MLSTTTTARAAFIDRDGTIIVEKNYLNDPTQVQLLPGAVEGLLALQAKGFLLFVVSNQSGIARGKISQAQFESVHSEFALKLEKSKITITDFLYCPHAPNANCPCRKPKTGMIPREWQKQTIDFSQSLVAGDKVCDLEMGIALGAKTFLVLTGYGEETKKSIPATPKVTVVADLYALSLDC